MLSPVIAALSQNIVLIDGGLTGLYCNEAGVMGLQEQGTSLHFDFKFFSGGFACGNSVLTARRGGIGVGVG